MKKVKEETVYGYRVERYDLDEAQANGTLNAGLRICFALATSKDVDCKTIECRSESEGIGVPSPWYYRSNYATFKETYGTVEDFLRSFDCEEFETWTVDFVYNGTDIGASGKKDDAIVGISYDAGHTPDIKTLMLQIEEEARKAFEYGLGDDRAKALTKTLREDYQMSWKRVAEASQKLLAHQDIYEEYTSLLLGSSPIGKQPVTVEGYTADKLHSDYPLSMLGAYNFLIYLRTDPERALEDLRKGLPRK